MQPTTNCPTPLELQALITGDLDDLRQQDCTRHLGECVGCQQAIELTAAGDSEWSQLVAGIDEVLPGNQSAYWSVVDAARSPFAATMISPATIKVTETKLDFLEASDDPASLGRLEHFEVLRVLGRGGMGIVLEAFDQNLRRSVAIKVLDPQLQANELARQRFCREARAAAAISHENVVPVHHVATADDKVIPYLVMQLVRGESLESRLSRDGQLPVKDILMIGMQAAAGLAAAHAQNLIHRDIKPGNILLEEGTGRVKLTDFGLARMTEDIKLTQTGFVTGTPMYMAPEQALGEESDERADLFSLGAVLYEMAAGRAAFSASSVLGVLKKITETTPPSLRVIRPDLPEGVVILTEQLLSKRPEDRPAVAQAVADALAVILATISPLSPLQVPSIGEGAACEAVRAALSESGQSICQKQRLRARIRHGLIGASIGILLTLAIALPWMNSNRDNQVIAPLPSAQTPSVEGENSSVEPVAVLAGNAGPVWAVAFSPDASTLAMAIDDGSVKLWDVPGKRVRSTFKALSGPVWGMAMSADGKLLVTGGDDSKVRVFAVESATELHVFETMFAIRTLAFVGRTTDLIVGGRTGQVEVWNVERAERRFATAGHTGTVVGVAGSSDGRMLASVGGDKSAKLWNAATGTELLTLDGHNGGVYGVAFSPDGSQVVTSGWDKTVRLWDTASGTLQHTCEGHGGDVWAVAFSPSTPYAASVGEDRIVRVWQTEQRAAAASLKSHTGTLYAATFSRDGRWLATAGRDGTARLWDMQQISTQQR